MRGLFYGALDRLAHVRDIAAVDDQKLATLGVGNMVERKLDGVDGADRRLATKRVTQL